MHELLLIGLETSVALLLLLIIWQDWHTRSVTGLVFPVLGALLLIHRLITTSAAPVAVSGWDLFLNWSGLAMLLLLLSLYMRLRFRSTGQRLRDGLGSGDVAFWFAAASYFSPVSFLLYFLVSSLLALVCFGLLRWGQLAGPDPRVPLAGLQAGCLLLLLLGGRVYPAWGEPTGEVRLLTWLTTW